MKDSHLQLASKRCGNCQTKMIFQPGCCGNLPVWRCPDCGRIAKWQESNIDSNLYLKLK